MVAFLSMTQQLQRQWWLWWEWSWPLWLPRRMCRTWQKGIVGSTGWLRLMQQQKHEACHCNNCYTSSNNESPNDDNKLVISSGHLSPKSDDEDNFGHGNQATYKKGQRRTDLKWLCLGRRRSCHKRAAPPGTAIDDDTFFSKKMGRLLTNSPQWLGFWDNNLGLNQIKD